MYLTKEEEQILAGEKGPALQKAMEILYSLGIIYNAENLIPISSAQISGVSYKTLGDGGIDFLEKLSDARVTVKTTLNPIGFDLEYPDFIDTDLQFIAKQMKILTLYKSMGILGTYTCTPYYFENIPKMMDHVAWAESSAIVYANSVIGARTNRESGVSALAAALIGKTANYGLHIEKNRKATVVINLNFEPQFSDLSAIGLIIGEKIRKGIPYIIGIRDYTNESLKALGAAMNASGSIPMFHVDMITPEWKMAIEGLDKIDIEKREIEEFRQKIHTEKVPELIALGCPHLSLNELKEIAKFVKGKKKKESVQFWLFTSRSTKQRAYEHVKIIEDFGGKVYADTCMVVAPLDRKFKVTGTSSGKAAYYLKMPNFSNQEVLFYDLYMLLQMVVE